MSENLRAFEDPHHPGNSAKYQTKRKCVTEGCSNTAGTMWSPYWCFDCNVKRMKRIESGLLSILSDLRQKAQEIQT